MKSKNYPPISILKEKVMTAFIASGKDHLLITGNKNAGKTTLLKALLNDREDYGGLVTRLVFDPATGDRDHLTLEDILDPSLKIKVAQINPEKTRMIPNIEAFESLPVQILEKYRKSDKNTIVIDEIGYLEETAPRYIEEVYKCFKEKQVIATIRKEENEFLDQFKAVPRTFLIDLDNFIFK